MPRYQNPERNIPYNSPPKSPDRKKILLSKINSMPFKQPAVNKSMKN